MWLKLLLSRHGKEVGAPQELDLFGELLPQTCLRDQVYKRVQMEGGTGDDMPHALP